MEAGFVDGFHVGLVGGDDSGEELFPDGVVHELHALAFAGDDDILQFLCRAFAHNGGDGVVHDEDFVHGDATGAVLLFHEELGDDASKRGGEHGSHLRLLVARKHIDHTVHRFAGVVGVEGSEDKETGFGSGECEGDGFQIAHFTDEHDVRILAESRFEAGREGFRMFGNFALSDDAFFVAVNELDRLFDRHDVA